MWPTSSQIVGWLVGFFISGQLQHFRIPENQHSLQPSIAKRIHVKRASSKLGGKFRGYRTMVEIYATKILDLLKPADCGSSQPPWLRGMQVDEKKMVSTIFCCLSIQYLMFLAIQGAMAADSKVAKETLTSNQDQPENPLQLNNWLRAQMREFRVAAPFYGPYMSIIDSQYAMPEPAKTR